MPPVSETIGFQGSPPDSERFTRILAELAGLPPPEDGLSKLAAALKDLLAGQAALAELDLSDVAPDSNFDPRWE